jgi:drug/metabolite transporter (DMT)-like permease
MMYVLGIVVGVLFLVSWHFHHLLRPKDRSWRVSLWFSGGTSIFCIIVPLSRAMIPKWSAHEWLLICVYGVFSIACSVVGFRASKSGTVSRRYFGLLFVISCGVLARLVLPVVWRSGLRELVLGW